MAGVWESGGGSARARERFLASAVGAAGAAGLAGGYGRDDGDGWPGGGGRLPPVRRSILDSWQRCLRVGLLPQRTELPYQPELDPQEQLVRASAPVLERLQQNISGSRVSVLLADAAARILVCRPGTPGMRQHLDSVQVAPGFSYAEEDAGTNGIGTSLAERRLCTVSSSEHFTDRLQSFACAGAPVRDPLSGSILGILDLTCWHADAHPMMSALLRAAVADIERQLFEQYSERERRLLRSFFASVGRPYRTMAAGDGDRPGAAELGRSDRLALDDAAAELVGAARSAIVEVPLSNGLSATLLCRTVSEAEGGSGVSVQARLPHGQRLPVRPEERQPGDGGAGDQPYLLLVGEPGVGRLALAARQRLALICDSGGRIGTTLEVRRTAEELTEVSVPGFAHEATVDLWDWVLDGQEEPTGGGPRRMRRTALRTVRANGPAQSVGSLVHHPEAELAPTGPDGGRPVPRLDPTATTITVPIVARGTVLGVAAFHRDLDAPRFDDDDLSLARELVNRAAICLDNACRYTREHQLALTLQRSLLPRALPAQRAVEAAHRYLPAQGGVGGDWYDVIPLSGGRVALVVGDVVGHGLHAAATMGLLRTAVRNFSALDLPADELLGHLDALVDSLDQEESVAGNGIGVVGATCLYVVYDPVSQHCTMASAGHLPPGVVSPDGTAVLPEVPVGPPLGMGRSPFEAIDCELPEGTLLVLYTDGLVEDRRHDIDAGLARLRAALSGPVRSPERTCASLIAELLPDRPSDDVALLVARTRVTDAMHVASWDVPIDPAAVAAVRAAAGRQLAAWGLSEAAFTTELIVSELVTNAIRHAEGPVQLRLLRDSVLICEVADASSTSPRLRRARTTDEGGRGLFLVAQLAQRWGTRYTPSGGKVIWAEQPLTPRY
ncbi:SpoIIE family protein phosphatase [Streptacidiphilus sp. P02-A3a]|uniref:SpoIIE family protein phosphatase n=1 Tax=Streptacidiphilus sp. P02-A3a TaxID=2704468 RepID=UPI0015F8BAD6|nr:SpoIIE family protein phosphatase [Streptacidiphilus sp. P02-A3a]QMU68031.1 SpoIIE family protein phosphatase [Streptacidiphilus sp. P02-A3a]